MAVLIDTNILVRAMQPHHPEYPQLDRAFAILRAGSEPLVVAAQNLIEFWVVATRPQGGQNGLGMTPEMATKELATLKGLFPILPEPAKIFDEWERLVSLHQVSGKNAHDARLVAAMNLHGIRRILTFNGQDFARFKVQVLHPDMV